MVICYMFLPVGEFAILGYYTYICATMRVHNNLKDYSISLQGKGIEVANIESGELLTKENDNTYKLLTDETVYLTIKKKTIRLWRRFTDDMLRKLYDQSKPIDTNAPAKSAQVTKTTSAQVKAGKSAQVSINGHMYQSISEASAQLNINRRTIKKRLDDDANTDYLYV